MENNYALKLLHILASFMVFSLTIAKSLMAAVAFKHLIRFPKIRCFQCIFLQELVWVTEDVQAMSKCVLPKFYDKRDVCKKFIDYPS